MNTAFLLPANLNTAALWTSTNPILRAGELGVETDTNFFKYGDGATAWTSLSYATTPNALAGTVTSVALSLPNIITVSGSPVTVSGTLTGVLATQSANKVFAGPSSGSAAAPTFRSLVAADVPTLNQNTTGTAAKANAINSATTVVNTSSATAPTAGQVLTATSSTAATWQTPIGSPVTADLLAQSASVTSVLAVTAPNDGNPHQYRVGAYANITAVTLDVLQISCTYTDENSASQTILFFPMGLTSANLASVGAFAFPDTTIRVKANTAVTVKATLTTGTGSIAFDCGASITQLN